MISLNASGFAYNVGFKNPIGPLPAAILASFNSVTIPPMMGALRLVPPTLRVTPSKTVTPERPMAEMSGKPLIEVSIANNTSGVCQSIDTLHFLYRCTRSGHSPARTGT